MEGGSGGSVLTIDNMHLYGDMQYSYSNGYIPTVQGGKVKIYLPLVTEWEILGNAVQVTVDLGDAQSAPFVFQNFNKTVLLQQHIADQGASTVQAYLVELEIALLDKRMNGRYPITIQVSGTTTEGAFMQNFPLFITISDGEEEEQPIVEEVKPSSQPKLMIEEYECTPSPAIAGETFHVTILLKNTSTSQSVSNLMVTVSGESMDITPMDGTGAFYFKQIGTQKTASLELDMQVQRTAAQRPQKLMLQMTYEGKEAQAYSTTEAIVVQIQQPMRVEMDHVKLPEEVYIGETLTLPINVMNMGRAPIFNARAELQVEGLLSETSAFIGNIDSGSARQENLYAFVQGKLEEEQKYGNVSGTLILTYEDEFGNEYTEETPLKTRILAQVIASTDMEEQAQKEQKVKSDWWMAALIGGLLVVGAALTTFIVMKVRKNKQSEDEVD